eukprot:12415025-Ditylum_brightwellii.AAC.1
MTEDLLLYTSPFGGRPASSLDLLSMAVSTAVEIFLPLLPAFPERLQFDAVLSQASPKEIMDELGGELASLGVQCLLSSLLMSTSTGTSKGLGFCTWSDVVVSTIETNPCVRQIQKGELLLNVPCSCLVLIGSMLPARMPLDGLRKFASKYGIPGCRCMKKLHLC